MNYSIIPDGLLEEEITNKALNNRIEIQLNGINMEINSASGELIRVISTNPQDYLNYQPGAKISFQPYIG